MQHLIIEAFPGRTAPAILNRDGNLDRFTYKDEDADGFTSAHLSRHESGGWRLHLFGSSGACQYIAHSDNATGIFRQLPLSPYNLSFGCDIVAVAEASSERADDSLDEISIRDPQCVARAEAAREICLKCVAHSGSRSKWNIQCARSHNANSCVSLLRGECPDNLWIDDLVQLGLVSKQDLGPESSVDTIKSLIRSNFKMWPNGFHLWPNTQQAFRDEMAAFTPPVTAKCSGRGIVIPMGGKYYDAGYVAIRMIRHVGCRLPIEVWHLGADELTGWQRQALAKYDVTYVNAIEMRKRHPMKILGGWELKPFAIAYSSFEEVLLLDADCYPAKDPTYLFDHPDYKSHGAVLWADRRDCEPEAWNVLGIEHRQSRPVESGQLLIDKSRCWKELSLALWMNSHSDFYYRWWHGDKETFRFAWLYNDRTYAMPPGDWQWAQPAMLQPDFEGRVLFVHRANGKFAMKNSAAHGFTTSRQNQIRNDELPHEIEAWNFVKDLKNIRDGIEPEDNIKPLPMRLGRIVEGARGATVALIGAGGAHPDTVKWREGVCRGCEHLGTVVKVPKCTLCNCLVWAKARNLSECCPAGKWPDPSPVDYYSQGGEDQWIVENLKLRGDGVFVDVGAFDGKTDSNTLHFEKRGWTGLCIDGNPHMWDALAVNRKCEIGRYAVGSNAKRPFCVASEPQLSGLGRDGVPAEVAVKRLDDALREAGINRIDLLSLDAEGSEVEVWNTIGDIRPKIVVVEFYTVGIGSLEQEIRDAMKGYVLRKKLGANLILELEER